MEEGSFEISIKNESPEKEFDKNNASIKALHSFNTFLSSIETIAQAQFPNTSLTIDLGTNKIAIRSSTENIDKLQNTIKSFAENTLQKSNSMYKALLAIETVISANGLTYSAVIKGSKAEHDVTTVFERSKGITPNILTKGVEVHEKFGLNFYTGVIKIIDTEKKQNFIKFKTELNEIHYFNCTSKQIYELKTQDKINISGYSYKNNKGKIVKEFFDQYSDEEFEPFYTFYQQIDKLEGTEKLKFIYRFFNSYINNNELSRVVKFANVFLVGNTDVSILRIILDVLKKVNDEEVIYDTYNSLIILIGEKIGGIY